MKQTGLMFKGDLVRAILEGRKTQTRRVVKADWIQSERAPLQTNPGRFHFWCSGEHDCPFGKPGDLIYVRETWMDLQGTGVEYISDGKLQRYAYAADTPPGSYGDECRKEYGLKWRPSIHMPKSAARIWLEITGVRVERLQDISNEDALAEGVNRISHGREGYFYSAIRNDPHPKNWCYPDDAFRELWDSTGGDWSANPWVWVIDFKHTDKPAAH